MSTKGVPVYVRRIVTVTCDAPCQHGGMMRARGNQPARMWKCNRQVQVAGERCYQHQGFAKQ